MSVHWPSVTNLANSNIGVGILALPTCVKSMGYLLGCVVLIATGYITVQISNLLIHSAHHSKSRSYEQLSMKTYGNSGKRLCEVCICAMNYGMLVSFHCVIGDSSDMLAQILGVEDTPHWRLGVQLFVVLFMALPFSLLRNLSSLNILSVLALVIYSSFTLFIFSHGVGEWLIQTSVSEVPWIDIGGLLKSFPIIFLAFNCQTSLLPIYNELPNPSMKRMMRVASYAIIFVGLLYFIIGICGVLSFGVHTDGNVLNNFPISSLIVVFKLGFLLCIAVSFPLVIYPMRISVNSLILGEKGDPNHMTVGVFRAITAAIIFSSFILSIIFPEVDTVLALSGASAGSFIGMIFPALIFLKLSDRGEEGRGFAKLVLVIGFATTTLGVSNILFGGETSLPSGNLNPKHFDSDSDSLLPRVQLSGENEYPDAGTLGNSEIMAMLEKLQSELDETKRELRAEKSIRIETQIKELKEQLRAQNIEVESDLEVKVVEDSVGGDADNVLPAQPVEENPVVEQPVQQLVPQQVGQPADVGHVEEQPQENQKPLAEPLQPPAGQENRDVEINNEQQQPPINQPVQEEVVQEKVVQEKAVQEEVGDEKVEIAPVIAVPPVQEVVDSAGEKEDEGAKPDDSDLKKDAEVVEKKSVEDGDPQHLPAKLVVDEIGKGLEKETLKQDGLEEKKDGLEEKQDGLQEKQDGLQEKQDGLQEKQDGVQEKQEEEPEKIDLAEVQEKLKQLEKLEQEKVELMAEVLKEDNKLENESLDQAGIQSDNENADIKPDAKPGIDSDIKSDEVNDEVVETVNESHLEQPKKDGEM